MYLLYKIDLILFGGHGRDGFEMAVEVTLVKKAAFQGNQGQIKTFLQKFSGKFYPAIQSIRMRGYARGCLELPEQCVRVGLQLRGNLTE
jgi:hypothetical protein